MINSLRATYQFFPMMPACKQLKSQVDSEEDESFEIIKNQLTKKEADESRLVTKVKKFKYFSKYFI